MCFTCSDIDEDVSSIFQFSTALIVEATARCLKVINNDLEVSYKLPPGMSAKFRVGTSLANAVTVSYTYYIRIGNQNLPLVESFPWFRFYELANYFYI